MQFTITSDNAYISDANATAINTAKNHYNF